MLRILECLNYLWRACFLFLIKVSFPDHHEQDFQATPQDPEPDADPGSMVGALLDQDMHGEHVSLAQDERPNGLEIMDIVESISHATFDMDDGLLD